ncbi:MAG: YolD-like family protein [Oscillospiraceae bacterium]|nr:YolD-like family protein [Oscillospiraceae bacterium]
MKAEGKQMYPDIIALPRPVSHRPPMPRADRAKIFSPFSAVKGYDDAVENNARERISKPDHSPEVQERINQRLTALQRGEQVEVSCFLANPGPDGSGGMADGVCRRIRGRVTKLDVPFQTLRVGDMGIPFADILSITKLPADGFSEASL